MSTLTKEQLQRIEENKKRALAKRAEKLSQQQTGLGGANNKPKSAETRPQINPVGYGQGQKVTPGQTGHLRTQPGSPLQSKSKQFISGTVGQLSKNPCVQPPDPNKQSIKAPHRFGVSSQFSKPNSDRPVTVSLPTSNSDDRRFTQRIQQNATEPVSVAKTDSVNPGVTPTGVVSVKSFYSSSKTSGAASFQSKSTLQNKWTSNKVARGGQSSHCKMPQVGGSPPSKLAPLFGGAKTIKGECELISRDRFVVNVGFDSQLVDAFKSIESRSYDASTKKWTFVLKDYSKLMETVKSLSVQIEPLPSTVLRAFRAQLKGEVVSREIPEHNLNNVDSKLVDALMPFQREGVNFVISRHGRTLLADDMGLGKTIQSICVACYYRTEWPLLVVVPSSVKLTWAEAFRRWVPSLDPQRINVVMTGKDSVTSGLVNIISYDMMTRKSAELKSKKFQVVIMDESHSLKNFKTARTKAAMPVLKAAPRVLLLSGTPALSRPSELYTQIAAVDPKLFPSFHEFGVRYCAGHQNPWGWDYSGSSHMTELQLLLEDRIMLRRLKKNVLKQLPSKTRQMIVMDPGVVKTNSQSLKAAAKQMVSAGKNKKEQRGALLQYFSESGSAKIPAVSGYIFDLLDSGHKFLIFAHHQTMLDSLSQSLSDKGHNYIRIDGTTSSEKRKQLCDRFQRDDNCHVALLSITAASTGLTLHAASLVVFAELFWNPGVLVQAEDRVYRIGQKNCVNIHYLVAKGTADDYIWPLVQEKLNVLSKAGLTKDDFSKADTKSLKDPKQKSILNFFEESFMEEVGEEELQEIAALEAAVCGENSAEADSGTDQTVRDEPPSGVGRERGVQDGGEEGDTRGSSETTVGLQRNKNKAPMRKQASLFQVTGASSTGQAEDDSSQDEEPVIKRVRRR